MTARMAAKAAELGVASSTLYLRWANYEAAGLVGLLDKRLLQPSRRFSEVDERVVAAVRAVFDGQIEKSTITKDHYRLLVQARLDNEHGQGAVACPPRSTFNKLFDEVTRGRGAFGSAKARRSIAARPETPYRRFQATRPGEVVVLDSTPLDAFALDPVECRWVPLECLRQGARRQRRGPGARQGSCRRRTGTHRRARPRRPGRWRPRAAPRPALAAPDGERPA